MSRARLSLVGSVLAVGAALAAGHARTGGGGVAEADVRRARIAAPATPAEGEGGLVFRLSEGAEGGEAPALVARPPAERLADADARRVLDRLPPLAAHPREEPFAIREGSLPPPRTGRTARASFPPGEAAARPEAAPAGPLEVLRRMPEGDVPLAPHLSITFSQPMVALDSHAGLAREASPGPAVPAAPRRVAVGGHADARLRARGPLRHGHRLSRRGPGRHARGDRRGAGERLSLVVLDARRHASWPDTPRAVPRAATR